MYNTEKNFNGRGSSETKEGYPQLSENPTETELASEISRLKEITYSRNREGGDEETSRFIDERVDSLSKEIMTLFRDPVGEGKIIKNWQEGIEMLRSLAEGVEKHKAEKRERKDS